MRTKNVYIGSYGQKNGTVLKTSRTATSTVLWLQFLSYALNFFFLRSKKKKNKLKKLLGSRAEIKFF